MAKSEVKHCTELYHWHKEIETTTTTMMMMRWRRYSRQPSVKVGHSTP